MKDHETPTHDFASVTDFNNLYQSFTEARKGKRWKYSVCKYEANVLENLLFIQVMLQRHKYRLSPYNCFYVHEPKERLIMYNSFRDKIVQHCLCEQVLEPVLSKTFIYDNYASQKGKGTHFGLDRLKSFMSAYDTEAGFLANFEADFRNAILNSTIRVAKNSVTDGGGYEDIVRQVFLLSNTNVGLSNENGVAEGSLWSYFNSASRRQCYAKPLEYGFRGHFVPGHWDGKSFVYQPKDPQGGMFVHSLIPGHYTLERAVNATKRTQDARLQRRFEQELKKRGYMKYFK